MVLAHIWENAPEKATRIPHSMPTVGSTDSVIVIHVVKDALG